MYERIDLLGLERRFPDEESCKAYLFKQRWPQGFKCPRCGGRKAGFHRGRKLYQCKNCRYQASLTAGTIFHKTRIPLKKWFWLIFLLSRNKQGISMKGIQRLLSIGSYETVWRMAHKVRTAMAARDARYQLAGLIELDESYFGGRKEGKRGRGASGKAPVMVALSTTPKGDPAFLRMKVIEKVNSSQAHKTVKGIIRPGERIKTDSLRIYSQLNELGFSHEAELQGNPRKKKDSFLLWLHTIVSNAKRFLQGAHYQESPRHLQRFLDEFCYRFNRRFKEAELFDRLLTACVTARAVTYAELKG